MAIEPLLNQWLWVAKEPMAIGPLLNQYRANLSFYNKTNKNKNCFKLNLKTYCLIDFFQELARKKFIEAFSAIFPMYFLILILEQNR